MIKPPILCKRIFRIALPVLLLFSAIVSPAQVPLPNAFAHNDYWHSRPLFDALDNGYRHVEADIYLRGGRLVVAHVLPFFRKKRTLEQLYLDPLFRLASGSDPLLSAAQPLTLMIDIKSESGRTWTVLEKVLRKYRSMLTSYNGGQIHFRSVTVILTGHKPAALLVKQSNRLAFIDEDLRKVKPDSLTGQLFRTASCKYSSVVKWDGRGEMPERDRERLIRLVAAAHSGGRKVRLWASPENRNVWAQLLGCGVDLINTDRLVTLRDFLLRDMSQYAKAE